MSRWSAPDAPAVSLVPVDAASLEAWLTAQDESTRRWVRAQGYTAPPASWLSIPGADGAPRAVLVGVGEAPWALAHLPLQLPAGDYALDSGSVTLDPAAAAFGFALGAYQFTRYRAPRRAPARLKLPADVDVRALDARIDAALLVRDLVNTPTEDLGPEQLAAAAEAIATRNGARFAQVVGEALLARNFPAIHAVGRASHRAPRLIELEWGDPSHPRVAIVGKGVCFDTGGLDIKPGDGMRWMKKDMGGAAHALALADWIMRSGLRVRLQVLVPAVENAIGPLSYRPGEVLRTRAGLTVEIDNTDAEGRVILGDALSYAAESQPELMIDFATLTGAARIALGPELPALFCNRDALADAVLAAGRAEGDPLWRLPLWRPYRSYLDSTVADFANAGGSRLAGAITAALYLERFVPESLPWVHVDVYSWNDIDRPGRPRGGEAQSLRAMFAMLGARYG